MSADARKTLAAVLRDEKAAAGVIEAIREECEATGPVRLMEVCGTHTVAIRRSGIPALLPETLELLSGPGCPVCVTPNRTLDRALAISRLPGVTIATFGDMVRVPGSSSSLEVERARGADVRVVYSPLDALEMAGASPERQIVFLGVGFETTAPAVAVALERARSRGTRNFSVLCAHKLVPPALEALAANPSLRVDGLICPGHVSVIIGADAYRPLASGRGIPCVVAGFEPVDVLLAILMLLRQIRERRAEVEVEYRAAVHREGNRAALEIMDRVFETVDSVWRGLGEIPASGFGLREEFADHDAARRFAVEVEPEAEHPGCMCGDVLVGAARPTECPLFGADCTPETPVGPCMVSSEGTCAAYHRYGGMR